MTDSDRTDVLTPTPRAVDGAGATDAPGTAGTTAPAAGDPGPDPAPSSARPHQWRALAGFAGAVTGAAVLGARFGPAAPSVRRWYRALDKPPFTPPDAVFGPVWTTLYAAIAASGWRVWRRPDSPARTRALGLWTAQLAANAAWSPTFFGARRPRLALGVLAAQLASTAGYAAVTSRVDRPAAALMAPYLGWSGFAGVLNAEVARRNPT